MILPLHTRPRCPRRETAFALAFGCAFLAFAGNARAQIVEEQDADGDADVNVSFMGNIAGSIMMVIQGTATTSLSGYTNASMPAPATATINLGNISAVNPVGTNCRAYRVTAPVAGAICAADLIAFLVYNGSTTGGITVERKNPAGALPDVPAGNLRVASPPLASWTASTQGTAIGNPGSPTDICLLAGDTTCQNLVDYEHELAVFIPDTQAQGPFSTVILYSGTTP